MAGYGFSQGVDSLQQGMAWKDQQDKQNQVKEANSAFQTTLAERQKAHENAQAADLAGWMESGKPEAEFQAKPWQPADTDYLAATQARQAAFAKQGNFDGYMQSAAAVMPMISQIRQKALNEYGNDEAELAKAVYPTFMDNRDLKSADWVDGTSPDGKKTEKQLRLVLNDGSTRMFKPGEVTQLVQRSTQSPQAQLAEAQAQFKLKQSMFEKEANAKLEGDKQAGRLKLEDVKAGYAKALAGVNNGYRLDQIGAAGVEARKTRAVPTVSISNGGGGGSSSSLSLRGLQQQVINLKGARQAASTDYSRAMKLAESLPYDQKAAAIAKLTSDYQSKTARFDAAYNDLNSQLKDATSGGKSKTLAGLPAPDASPETPAVGDANGFEFKGWVK